jgi:5-amino-6-(5-phospho-D-ribitylamino)uracil phosphatase
MPIRLIAVDLDGTLVNSHGDISTRNLASLREASARGAAIIIVTGRRFHSARPFVEQVKAPVTIISSNGARIGSSEGEVFYSNFLPRAVACQIVGIAAAYQGYAAVLFDIPGRGQIVMHQEALDDGPLGWYRNSSPGCIVQVKDLRQAIRSDPLQVMFGGPPAAIEPLEPLLRASSAATCIHLTWTKYLSRHLSLLDVMNRGCSKGSALAWWSRRCGISAAEIMAIGDNLNDVEMLQLAGQPVLMANHGFTAVPDGWPLTGSNDEDGVAQALDRYFLSASGQP